MERVKLNEQLQTSVNHGFIFPQVFLLSLLLIISGCSVSEQISESSPVDEPVSESPVPGWYLDGQAGGYSNGIVSGFGKAAGRSEAPARENARMLAVANFKYWVDTQLEESRKAGEDDLTVLSQPGFIRNLRNAVQYMDSGDLVFQSESYESDGVVYAVVRAGLPAETVLSRVGTALASWSDAWAMLSNSGPVQQWRVDAAGN